MVSLKRDRGALVLSFILPVVFFSIFAVIFGGRRDTTPKVKVITDNLVETSHLVRSKAQEFDATLSDLNNRTRKQVQNVDGMITSTLTATAEIAGMVERGIKVPMREIAGLANGFKAGMNVLIGRVKGFGAERQG